MTVVPRLYSQETLQGKMQVITSGGGGFPWDVPPCSLNTDPISDQNVILHTHFRTGAGPLNPYLFTDLEVITKHNITCLHKTKIMSSLVSQSATKNTEFAYYTSSLIHLELKRLTH